MVLGQYWVVLVSTWWYWVKIGWYWSLLGGTGSILDGTGQYLVVLGHYWMVLGSTRVNYGQLGYLVWSGLVIAKFRSVKAISGRDGTDGMGCIPDRYSA